MWHAAPTRLSIRPSSSHPARAEGGGAGRRPDESDVNELLAIQKRAHGPASEVKGCAVRADNRDVTASLETPALRVEDRSAQPSSPRWRDRAEWVAYASVLCVWLLYVLPARGGWQSYVVPVATVLLLPALLVLRPWVHCSRLVLTLASLPAAGALVAAAAAPYGDGGPISLSRWGYFGGVLLATAAFGRTPVRRIAVIVAILLAGLLQYSQAWLPWWGGGGTVDGPMLGTVYSANPFGSLMLAFTLVAAAVAVLAPAPLRRLGLVVAPLCACGVVLSAARAAMLVLVCGGLVLAVVALRVRGARGLGRVLAVAALSYAALLASTSSVFFAGESNALAATTTKTTSGQTLDSTTSVRLDYWRAAAGQFADHPVVGGGSGSYMGNSRLRMSPAAERSPFAHNEVLGSLAEGGLALGLPVLALFVLAGGRGALVLLHSLRCPAAADPVALAATLGAGALLLHGLADFALSFPAILAFLAVLLGLGPLHAGPAIPRRGAVALTLLPVLLCGGYLGLSHDRAGVSSSAQPGSPEALPGLHDARILLAQARGAEPDEALAVAAQLEPVARLDGQVEALRLDLLDLGGRPDEARRGARVLATVSRQASPLLLLPYAKRLDDAAAADLLLREVYDRAGDSGRVRGQLVDLLAEVDERGARPEPGWSCAVRALQRHGGLADDNPVVLRADPGATAARCATWTAGARTLPGEAP